MLNASFVIVYLVPLIIEPSLIIESMAKDESEVDSKDQTISPMNTDTDIEPILSFDIKTSHYIEGFPTACTCQPLEAIS